MAPACTTSALQTTVRFGKSTSRTAKNTGWTQYRDSPGGMAGRSQKEVSISLWRERRRNNGTSLPEVSNRILSYDTSISQPGISQRWQRLLLKSTAMAAFRSAKMAAPSCTCTLPPLARKSCWSRTSTDLMNRGHLHAKHPRVLDRPTPKYLSYIFPIHGGTEIELQPPFGKGAASKACPEPADGFR